MMVGNIFRIDLIFRIHDKECPKVNKFDKRPLLLNAGSPREAYQKALVTASLELERLNRPLVKEVKWEFVGLENFKTIEHREVEEETVYVIENPEDAMEYMRQLRIRNNSIQTQIAKTG